MAPKSSKAGRKAGKKGKKSVESWKIYIYKVPLDVTATAHAS